MLELVVVVMFLAVAVLGVAMFVGRRMESDRFSSAPSVPDSVAAWAASLPVELGDRVRFRFAGHWAGGTVCGLTPRHAQIFAIHRRGEREKWLNGHIAYRPITAVKH